MSVSSPRSRIAALAVALAIGLVALAADQANDPAITNYGTLNPAAPPELGVFAFLVGSWSGTATAQNSDGTTSEFQFDWIGRYVLDGLAIADEMRIADGGAVQGMSLRFYDPAGSNWVVEFLNFNRSFLRKQVNAGTGAVTRDDNRIVIAQSGINGALGREVYTLLDDAHFTYSLDMSQDGGQTWDTSVTIDMRREEAP